MITNNEHSQLKTMHKGTGYIVSNKSNHNCLPFAQFSHTDVRQQDVNQNYITEMSCEISGSHSCHLH